MTDGPSCESVTAVGEHDHGADLSDLWDAEVCSWRIEHRPGHLPWTVLLEWTDEHDGRHDALWTTFTWEFYGDTVDEALSGAVEWCWELAPWRRCDACGGEGRYWGPPNRMSVHRERRRLRCDECKGSGLATTSRGDAATEEGSA